MTLSKIAIIIGTTRTGRFADHPAGWLKTLVEPRSDAVFETIDLRDWPLPIYDDPKSPLWATPENELAQAWGRKLAEFDGFIFITAEYNHGIPAVLKNAIDWVYPQLNRKAASFVGYGGVGAARAIEQLRLNLIETAGRPAQVRGAYRRQRVSRGAAGPKDPRRFPPSGGQRQRDAG